MSKSELCLVTQVAHSHLNEKLISFNDQHACETKHKGIVCCHSKLLWLYFFSENILKLNCFVHTMNDIKFNILVMRRERLDLFDV